MKKHRSLITFFRSFFISSIILGCLAGGILGICVVYENTVRVQFGEERRAVEITENGIHILDFTL